MEIRVQGKYYIRVEKVTCDKCTMGKADGDGDGKRNRNRNRKCKDCDGTGFVLAIPFGDIVDLCRSVLSGAGLTSGRCG